MSDAFPAVPSRRAWLAQAAAGSAALATGTLSGAL